MRYLSQLSHTPEYRTWYDMRRRCLNSNHSDFSDYGGRGIAICERWGKFEHFLADLGPRPSASYSLGRKDNDGPYSPDNCAWQTPIEQHNNTRANLFLSFGGTRLTVGQWARKLHLPPGTLKSRIGRYGWSIERALTEPVDTRKRKISHRGIQR